MRRRRAPAEAFDLPARADRPVARRTGARLLLVGALGLGLTPSLGLIDQDSSTERRFFFRTTADAHVVRTAPERNFGQARRLRIERGRSRAFLRFSIDGLEGRITQVILKVMPVKGTGSVLLVKTPSHDRWTERGVDYGNAPALAESVASAGQITAGRWVVADVTGAVSGEGRVSVALTARGGRVVLRSGEATRQPRLVVHTTTEPEPTPSTTSPPPTASPSPTPSPTPSASPFPPGFPIVAAAGDVACDPADPYFNQGNGTPEFCRMRYTSDLLVQRSPTAVLVLGDTQYEIATAAAFRASYDPTWGRVKAITHPVPGNHEYRGGHTPTNATDYFDYFGPAAGPRMEGYYSRTIGTWHIIALNSNCTAIGGCGPGSPQGNWLASNVSNNRAPCTLAFWHHPLFSSGLHADDPTYGGTPPRRSMWETLYAAGVDVVLNGHEHFYERFAPQDPNGNIDLQRGIRQFTVGTGGKSKFGFSKIHPNSEARGIGFGVLELSLRGDGYDWRFVSAEGDTYTDSGSGNCH